MLRKEMEMSPSGETHRRDREWRGGRGWGVAGTRCRWARLARARRGDAVVRRSRCTSR
jgi:hypothetical protein